MPDAMTDGRFCATPMAKLETACRASGTIDGSWAAMPSMKPTMAEPAAPSMSGMFSTMPDARPPSIAAPPSMNAGRLDSHHAVKPSSTAGRPSSTQPVARSVNVWKNVSAICATRGTTLPAAVMMESTSWSVMADMFALSLPSAATQLRNAALAELTDPSMVVAASSAVVPVMPISSWTRWIASTMSAYESMARSPASPFAALSSLALAMSRFISDLVPP